MSIAVAVAVGGCGGMQQTHVSDQQLAKVSAADRDRIESQQRRIDLAEQHAAASRRSVDEARQFRLVAMREQDGAEAELEAAQKARVLAAGTRDPNLRAVAVDHETTAQRKLAATQALGAYAAKVVQLREQRVRAADAATRLARANSEALKAEAVAGGQPSDLTRRAERSREAAANQLREERLKVQEQQSQTQALRDLWLQRRSALTASRGTELPVLEVPPPPANIGEP